MYFFTLLAWVFAVLSGIITVAMYYDQQEYYSSSLAGDLRRMKDDMKGISRHWYFKRYVFCFIVCVCWLIYYYFG